MPKIETEHIDAAQLRTMAARLGDYVAQMEKCAEDMDRHQIDGIDAQNAAAYDRALKELNRTSVGLMRGVQVAINRRIHAVPFGKPRKPAGTTGLQQRSVPAKIPSALVA